MSVAFVGNCGVAGKSGTESVWPASHCRGYSAGFQSISI